MKRRQHDDYDDDDVFDKHGILRDGQSVRVSLFDSLSPVQQAVARDAARLTDAAGNAGTSLRRPGYRVLLEDDAGAHARELAYSQYRRQLCDAWKTPSGITGSGERGERGAREGDLCTIDGKPGHLKMVSGSLRCVPDAKVQQDHQQNMDGIYAAHDAELTQAWRRG